MFDRTKMDCTVFLRKWQNYFKLIDDVGVAKLTDAQKINRVVQRLDVQQIEWHTKFEKDQRKIEAADGFRNDDHNAYTELTYRDFCDNLIAHTEVLTADHMHRLQFNRLALGKLEDPGCFHLAFTQLTARINTLGDRDLYYA